MTEEQSDAVSAISVSSSTDFSAAPTSSPPVSSATVPTQTRRAAVTAAPTTPTSPTEQPTPQHINAAVNRANINLASYNRVLDFEVDTGTGLSIARIRNAQTGEVLQQMPSADLLHLAQLLADWSPGKDVLIDLIA
jgi:flagellar protein FlaG